MADKLIEELLKLHEDISWEDDDDDTFEPVKTAKEKRFSLGASNEEKLLIDLDKKDMDFIQSFDYISEAMEYLFTKSLTDEGVNLFDEYLLIDDSPTRSVTEEHPYKKIFKYEPNALSITFSISFYLLFNTKFGLNKFDDNLIFFIVDKYKDSKIEYYNLKRSISELIGLGTKHKGEYYSVNIGVPSSKEVIIRAYYDKNKVQVSGLFDEIGG